MKKLGTSLVVLLFLAPLISGAQEMAHSNSRTILVTGNAEASAPPDKAVVRLGATIQAGQADVAQAKVNEILQKALEGIEKAGAPKKAILTSGLMLSPVYSSPERGSEGPKVTGFRASNTVEVTLDDTKLVGKVIDAGIAAGANELRGVSFGLRNDLPQRSKALTLAAEEARSKAQTIAKALDLQLGQVVEVNESGVQVMPMNENFFGGARMMAANAAPTQVEPGEVRVQANVSVRYEIGAPQRR